MATAPHHIDLYIRAAAILNNAYSEFMPHDTYSAAFLLKAMSSKYLLPGSTDIISFFNFTSSRAEYAHMTAKAYADIRYSKYAAAPSASSKKTAAEAAAPHIVSRTAAFPPGCSSLYNSFFNALIPSSASSLS